jgi:hypothetical protein
LIGQLGDNGNCSKWLNQKEIEESKAEIVFALEEENISFIRNRIKLNFQNLWIKYIPV